jgi:hypothetical protein
VFESHKSDGGRLSPAIAEQVSRVCHLVKNGRKGDRTAAIPKVGHLLPLFSYGLVGQSVELLEKFLFFAGTRRSSVQFRVGERLIEISHFYFR